MQLIADRFWTTDGTHAIDLATGARVELVTSTAGGASEHARWSERCAQFAELRHRVIAPLVDFGAFGEGKRFEAWRNDGPWPGAREPVVRVARLAHHVMMASARTSAGEDSGRVRILDHLPVLMPDAGDGYARAEEAMDASGAAVDLPIDALGLRTLQPGAVRAIADSFLEGREAVPRTITLWGSAGSGIGRAIQQIAVAARRSGFVPLSIRAMQPGLVATLKARSICFIARDDPAEAWRLFVEWSAHASRPHVLIFAGEHDVPGVPTVPLDRFPAEVLVAAVRPLDWTASHRGRIEAAARRSQGLPGRFAALVWPAPRIGERRLALVKASEPRTVYGDPEASATPLAASAAGRPGGVRLWPASTELRALRQGLDQAILDLGRGRHAHGERAVRHVASALARRGDASEAARGWLALAGALRRRGQLAQAQSALGEVRQLASQLDDGHTPLVIRAAIASGSLAVDALRLSEAETLLRAASHAAAGVGDASLVTPATVALARCLFWVGRYEEGSRVLQGPLVQSDAPDGWRCSSERSRLAIGRGDLAEAVAEATEGMTRAAAGQDFEQVAVAASALAFAHLAVGDAPAVIRDTVAAITAARRARCPHLGLGARLLAAESARRTGSRRSGTRLARRLKSMAAGRLPPLVRARAALLADLLVAEDSRACVERHQQATGLAALRLFVPAEASVQSCRPTEAVVQLLQVCQTAADAASVLSALARELRGRLRAAAVGFFLDDAQAPMLAASDGGRVEVALATRVQASAQPIAPHAVRGGAEGGAAVRYGGRTIGALAVRWSVGEPAPDPTAGDLIAMAAVAGAPALSEIAARRARPGRDLTSEILGVSRAIDEVRRAVERAAAAPFAVLIAGESGSGKELVARALHRRGPRRERGCCIVNCAALPDDLIESELFGHARGAFTGAMVEKAGVFEEAHLGTLFLDEVGELSARAQAKVLRAIQDGEIRRVGENQTRRIDVRLVAATNRDLRQEVRQGRFRLDLFYRLDVIRIAVPPLRERREDIPMLAEFFWRDAMQRLSGSATLGASVLSALARYDWPGNIRELQNVLAAIAVRCPRRGVVPVAALPPQIVPSEAAGSWRLDAARRTFDTSFVRAALVRSGGHRGRAADELGVTRQGLAKLITRLGLAAGGPGE